MATYTPKDAMALLNDDGIACTDKQIRAYVRGIAADPQSFVNACGSGNRYAWDAPTFARIVEGFRAKANGRKAHAPAKSVDEIREALAEMQDEQDEQDA